MKTKKQGNITNELAEQKEWGPVKITLVTVVVALGLDFVCYVLTRHSDLFKTLFRIF